MAPLAGLAAAGRRAARDAAAWGFGTIVRARELAYRGGLRKRTRLAVPTVSIGNLAVGGTGKTPFAMFLAQRLLAAGRSPGILARGYRREQGFRLNDEGREIERVLGDAVPQEQDACRALAAQRLLARRPEVDVLLLDDGFQHFAVARDLDIVLLDARRSLASQRLLPAGRLRETPAALARADLVVLGRCEGLDRTTRLDRMLEVGQFTSAPLLETTTTPSACILAGQRLEPAWLRGRRVVVASGIATPDHLRETLERLGAIVLEHHDWGDHRTPAAGALLHVARCARAAGADVVVVTRKDAARLGTLPLAPGAAPIVVLEVETRLTSGADELDAALARVLGGLSSAQ